LLSPNCKLSKSELTKLFQFSTSKTHFLFKSEFYDQVDGVAMGSPLAPVLANLYMAHHILEKNHFSIEDMLMTFLQLLGLNMKLTSFFLILILNIPILNSRLKRKIMVNWLF